MEDTWLTSREIAMQYGLTVSTVRVAIHRKKIVQGTECRKRGRDWEVRQDVAERLWGTKGE